MLASPAAEILRLARIGIGPFERVGFRPLSLALLARCAAAILARLAADKRSFLRETLPLPSRLPKAASAESSRDNSACARSLSFLNCRITPEKLAMVPSRAEDCSKGRLKPPSS
jgi:hypothetical protein